MYVFVVAAVAVCVVILFSIMAMSSRSSLTSELAELANENIALCRLVKDLRESLGRKHQLIKQIETIASSPRPEMSGFVVDHSKTVALIRSAIERHGDTSTDRMGSDLCPDEPETKVNGHPRPDNLLP